MFPELTGSAYLPCYLLTLDARNLDTADAAAGGVAHSPHCGYVKFETHHFFGKCVNYMFNSEHYASRVHVENAMCRRVKLAARRVCAKCLAPAACKCVQQEAEEGFNYGHRAGEFGMEVAVSTATSTRL